MFPSVKTFNFDRTFNRDSSLTMNLLRKETNNVIRQRAMIAWLCRDILSSIEWMEPGKRLSEWMCTRRIRADHVQIIKKINERKMYI